VTRRYSVLSLIKEGLAGQTGWQPAWRTPEPKPGYDASSSAAAGTGSPPPTTSPRTTAIGRVA